MKNPVHKFREQFNRPATHKDKKKEDKRGKSKRWSKHILQRQDPSSEE